MQILALVPEIYKFEKCVKYANEMTDDVIHSTQYYILCINRAILGKLAAQIIETWQANSSTENTPTATKNFAESKDKARTQGVCHKMNIFYLLIWL